jgi:hypothetical protein
MRILLRILVGLLVGTFAAELAFRAAELPLIWRVLPVAAYLPRLPDPDLASINAPGGSGFWLSENRAFVKFNALGMHDVERSATPPAGTRRVVVLGDSMTEALQVDRSETYVALAEKRLRAAGERVEVLNLGLSNAYDAVQVELMRTRGAGLQPDALVVATNATVDGGSLVYPLRDDRVLPAYRRDDAGDWFISKAFRDDPEYRFWSGPAGSLTRAALEHSRLARIVNQRWKSGFWSEHGTTGAARRRGPCVDAAFAAHWRLWVERSLEPQGARLDAYLGDLATLGRAGAVPVTLVLIGPTYDCPDSRSRAAALEDAIRKRVERFGLRVVFAATEMRRHLPDGADVRGLFGFKADVGSGHLNHRGHEVMADVLTEIIRRR